jgi:hypothetical protein
MTAMADSKLVRECDGTGYNEFKSDFTREETDHISLPKRRANGSI